MKKTTRKRTVIKYSAIILACAVFGFLISLILRVPQFTLMNTSSFTGNFSSRIVALAPVSQEGEKGTLLIRLSDGVSQFFKGFTSGITAENIPFAALYKDNDVRIISNGSKVSTFSISSSGSASNAYFSHDGAFVSLQTDAGKDHAFCIVKLPLEQNKSILCNSMIMPGLAPQSGWLTSKPHVFAASTSDKPNEFSVWDADENKGYKVLKDSEATEFNLIQNEYTPKPLTNSMTCAAGRCVEYSGGAITVIASPFGFSEVVKLQPISLKEYQVLYKGTLYFFDTKNLTFFISSPALARVALEEQTQALHHE